MISILNLQTCAETKHLPCVLFAVVECPSLLTPFNGTKSTDANIVDTLVRFSCRPGYKALGSLVLQCEEEGTWNGTVPSCEGETFFGNLQCGSGNFLCEH